MSLHLVIEDNTEDPQVPEPTVCPECKGTRGVARLINGASRRVSCPACCCEVCGDTTETAPLCKACDERQSRD